MRRETLQGLEPARVVVGGQEQVEVRRQLLMSCRGPGAIARRMAELDAVVCRHNVDAIRRGLDDGVQERHGALPVGCFRQACNEELRGSVDGKKQIELALARADLGNVDVEGPDWVDLELPSVRFVALDAGQTRDVMAL